MLPTPILHNIAASQGDGDGAFGRSYETITMHDTPENHTPPHTNTELHPSMHDTKDCLK